MVKAIIESGVGATAISELMVKKELQLSTLRAILVIDNREGCGAIAEIVRPFLKLKHRQRFQTRLSRAFEEMLTRSAKSKAHLPEKPSHYPDFSSAHLRAGG